jgi:tetratricopeptide (TPR) repeat protein
MTIAAPRVPGIVLLAATVVLGGAVRAARADVESAEASWLAGDREEAGRDIREWVKENPDGAHAPRVAAMLARTAVDPAEASTLWDEVIALQPTGALAEEAHWQKGMHAYSAGLYVAAAREFETVGRDFAAWSDPGRAYLWKAYSDLGADEPETALEDLKEAGRAAGDPEDQASIEFSLANVHFRLGNVAEALRRYQHFERQYRMDGRASAAARRTVECLRLLGRESEASAAAARIEQEYPDSFEATLARAEIRTLRDREVAWKEGKPGLPPSTRKWEVQVAAMSDPRNAAALRRQILALGINDIRVEPGDSPGGPVHRVILGPYPDQETARAMADSVAAIGELNPRVREVDTH